MSQIPSIDVFQNLYIAAADGNRALLRNRLIGAAKDPWFHDLEAEARTIGPTLSDEEKMLVFTCEENESSPAAKLTLWPDEPGEYRVTNVIPTVTFSLTEREYNSVLRQFIGQVLGEVKGVASYRLSQPSEGPEDWTSPAASSALWTFSQCANKSSAAAHPSDGDRWQKFIVLAHRSKKRPDPSLLRRWLAQGAGWPLDVAHELSLQYEFGLELLGTYDQVAL